MYETWSLEPSSALDERFLSDASEHGGSGLLTPLSPESPERRRRCRSSPAAGLFPFWMPVRRRLAKGRAQSCGASFAVGPSFSSSRLSTDVSRVMGLLPVVENADDDDDDDDDVDDDDDEEHDEAAVSGPCIGAVSETSDDDDDVAAVEFGATVAEVSVERKETDLRGEFVAPPRFVDLQAPIPEFDDTKSRRLSINQLC